MWRQIATTRRGTFVIVTISASIGLVCSVARGAAFHIDDARLPDPILSPGDVIEDAKVRDLCAPEATLGGARPSTALCEDAFAAYRIPEQYRYQYECAFVLPPAIGGTTTTKNIWPQPAEEAVLKHTVENALRNRICKGEMTPAQAQRDLVLDWTTAYRRYVVHDVDIVRDVAVGSPPPHDKTGSDAQRSPATQQRDTQVGSGDMPPMDPASSQPIEANISPNISNKASQNGPGGTSTGDRRANTFQDLKGANKKPISASRRSSALGVTHRSPGPLRR